MSLCYMFHKGRVILAGGGRVPERVRVDLRDDRPVFPAP